MTQRQRKNEHIYWAEKFYQSETATDLEQIRFVHQSIGQLSLTDISIETQLFGKTQAAPFYINAMTGGSAKAKEINIALAEIAAQTNIPLALGSASILTKEEQEAEQESFLAVRACLKEGTLLANIGLEHPLPKMQAVFEAIQADALQVHVNTAQELLMPEGSRDFRSWPQQLVQLSTLPFPVIIKEVGFGFAEESLALIQKAGVQYVDLSGRGGTNFAQIEIARGTERSSNLTQWGQTTAESLLEAQPFINKLTCFASGGIHSPLDVVKCLALGAKSVGVAGYFLHYLLTFGKEACLKEVQRWQEEIRLLCCLLNVRTCQELQQTDLILPPSLQAWIEQRQLPVKNFARRSKKVLK